MQGYRLTQTGYCEPENAGLSVVGGASMLATLSDMMLAMFFPEGTAYPEYEPRQVQMQVRAPLLNASVALLLRLHNVHALAGSALSCAPIL